MKTAFYAMEYEAWDMGTNRMSLEDEAAYLRLCHWMYRAAGPIENWTIYQLCGVWRCHPNKAHAILKRLKDTGKIVETPEGHLTNTRVTLELKEMETRRTQRANAARTGGTQSGVMRDKALESLEAEKPTVQQTTNKNELHYTTLPDTTLQKKETPTESANADEWSFDVFWKIFPNKIGKEGVPNKKGIVTGGARQAFERVRKSGVVSWDDFLAGLKRYVNKTDSREWCVPTTFLNQSRWADEPAAVAPKPAPGAPVPYQPKAKPPPRVMLDVATFDENTWKPYIRRYLSDQTWDVGLLGPDPESKGTRIPPEVLKALGIRRRPPLVNLSNGRAPEPWPTSPTSEVPSLDHLEITQ